MKLSRSGTIVVLLAALLVIALGPEAFFTQTPEPLLEFDGSTGGPWPAPIDVLSSSLGVGFAPDSIGAHVYRSSLPPASARPSVAGLSLTSADAQWGMR